MSLPTLKSAAVGSSIEVADNATYNAYTKAELVENILISGCLQVSNVKFGYYNSYGNWRDHDWGYASNAGNRQLGYFNKGASDFPLSEGLILSTGTINAAEGPNDMPDETDDMEGYSRFRDPDLEAISGGGSHDAAVLIFDFVAVGSNLEFSYIFASEEYREWTCSQFNDAFGFFLSGPGISGSVNLAKLSGGTEVTIENIHSAFTSTDASYYSSDKRGSYPCPAQNESYYIDNGSGKSYTSNSPTTQFDGMTTVLKAVYEGLQPGQTYQIKLAIADISDAKWDAGVFLEAKSFSTTNVNINQPAPVCFPNTIDLTAPAITVGSSPGLTYSYWQDELATIPYSSPETAPAGTYYIKGFDTSSGCSDIQPVTVVVHNVVITELNNYHNDLICIGGTDGSFKVEASGGTPPYSYSLDNVNFSNTSGIFEGLAAGVYNVYARDAINCEATIPLEVEITEPTTSSCRISKENCPPSDLTEVCFDGEGETPVYWTPPRLSYNCCASGGTDGSSFDVQFNIPESQNSCWVYNKTQRIGSNNMRLWQSATTPDPALYHGTSSDVFFVAPFQYFDNSVDIAVNLQLLNSSTAKTIGWNLVVLKANSSGTAYTIAKTYSDSKLLGSGDSSNPSETPWTITISANDLPQGSGVYKLKFEFTGPGSNKIEVDYIHYDAILSDLSGCSEGINFVVTANYNPGDEFPIGTTQVIYTGTLTQPGGFTLSDNCTFDVVVNDSPVPTGDSIQNFCSIDIPTISDLTVLGNNIQWYADATGGLPLNTTTSLIDGEDYYATQTIAGCESLARFKVTVEVNDPAKPTGETTQKFCTGGNSTIANLQVIGDNVIWYAHESDRTPLAETEPLVNGASYYATQTVNGCESDERFIVTVVIEECCTETVTASATDNSVCEGGDIELLASTVSGANSYSWSGPASFSSIEQNPTISNAIPSYSGDYIVEVSYGNNCVAKDTLTITVTPEPSPIVTNETICEDETYTWTVDGVEYPGTDGDTTVHYEGANCAPDTILNITVNDEPQPIVTNETICEDETYTWTVDGVEYPGTDGDTTVHYEGANCAPDTILNITVNDEPQPIVANETICEDETYTWTVDGVEYLGTDGDTTVHYEGANCAPDTILNITVNDEPQPIVTNETICEDETYTWTVDGVEYLGTDGDTTVHYEGANCAPDTILNITVNDEPQPIVTNETICEDETYTWTVDGVEYLGTDGDTTVHYEGANCAPDTILNITVNDEPQPIVTNETICEDETYTWTV
ncbi:choice-of-anchor L domain-containing protein, partial [Maribellus luteus]